LGEQAIARYALTAEEIVYFCRKAK
jgi:hypothetical protein